MRLREQTQLPVEVACAAHLLRHAERGRGRGRLVLAVRAERPASIHPFRSALEAGEIDDVLELISPDVVFNSPVVFRPYHRREAVAVILRSVSRVVQDLREIGAERAGDHALVFRARVGDREPNPTHATAWIGDRS